jgi:hypothetical protein
LVKEFGRISEFGWIIKKCLGKSYFGSRLFRDIIRETQFKIKNPKTKIRRAFSTPRVESRNELGQHLWGKMKEDKNDEMVIMQRVESQTKEDELEIADEEVYETQEEKELEIVEQGQNDEEENEVDDDDDDEEEENENKDEDDKSTKKEKDDQKEEKVEGIKSKD